MSNAARKLIFSTTLDRWCMNNDAPIRKLRRGNELSPFSEGLPCVRTIAVLRPTTCIPASGRSNSSMGPWSGGSEASREKAGSGRARHSQAGHARPCSAQCLDRGAGSRSRRGAVAVCRELARVLDDGDNMRVLPIVTRGIFDNVFDLLYLRGVDAAIVHGDVLEHFKKDQKISGIERHINYLMPLFPSEVHVFVRPEITKLEELAGKAVNFNTQGTAAAYGGPIIFERLGIKIEPRFIPHPVAPARWPRTTSTLPPSSSPPSCLTRS